MTPERIKPRLILDRIEELRKVEVANDLVEEIKRLADRCVPKDAIGGGWNAKGNKLRYKCPTCGAVIKGPAAREDYICSNCKQHINWWDDDDE